MAGQVAIALFETTFALHARTDLGMNSRFTTFWISDWMRMPRTVRILNGMSMALPPERIDRLFGVCMNGSYRGNPETQMHTILLAHPTVSGLTPSLNEANPELLPLANVPIVGDAKWFLGVDDRHLGPLDPERIRGLWSAGEIGPPPRAIPSTASAKATPPSPSTQRPPPSGTPHAHLSSCPVADHPRRTFKLCSMRRCGELRIRRSGTGSRRSQRPENSWF
jgi:hypothetical protein